MFLFGLGQVNFVCFGVGQFCFVLSRSIVFGLIRPFWLDKVNYVFFYQVNYVVSIRSILFDLVHVNVVSFV